MKFNVTLLTYKNDIKKRLKIPVNVDNSEWSDAYLLDAINDARRVFWEKARYKAKYTAAYFNSIIGTSDYTFVNLNIEDIDVVRYNNGTDKFTLKFVSIRDLLDLSGTAQSGDPEVWTFYEDKIKLYPTPATAVTNGIEVWGTKELSDLTTDASIDTDVEERYKELIERYALGLCWAEAEQEQQANYNFAMFEKRFDEQAFAINSMTMGENTGDDISINGDELSEYRFKRPIG